MKAICIGINDYPGADADLGGCVNDAHDWYDTLNRKMDGEPTILLDKKATKLAILDAVRRELSRLAPLETLVVTFSGHGTWLPDLSGDEPDGRDEALCPYDVSEDCLITDDELHATLLERDRKSRVILITDACHSGSVFRMFGPPGLKRKVRFLPPHRFVRNPDVLNQVSAAAAIRRVPQRVRPLPGILHISGCTDSEFSYDAEFNGRPNGALTRTLLNTLDEVGVNGIPTTYGQWFKAARHYLPSFEYPQTPKLNALKAMKDLPIFG